MTAGTAGPEGALGRRRDRRLTALILLTLAFIWGNSLLPPEGTWAVSGAVQRALAWLLPEAAGDAVLASGGGVAVRKLAHFTEFLVLGALLRARMDGRSMSLPLLAGLLAALADETIQFYTGRTSSVFDVWIDFAGAAVGTAIAVRLTRRRSAGRTQTEESGPKREAEET